MAVYLGISITQNSQSIANNTSNVTVKVNCSWTGGSHNNQTYNGVPDAGGWVTIDGTYYYFNSTFNSNKTSSGSQTLYTKTLDIKHNNDGTKTLSCRSNFNTGVSSGTISATNSLELTDIPRFATIKTAPNFNDEENPTITYSNPAGNSVTSLRACISLDGSNADVAYRDIGKTGTSYTFNLTDAERNVLRNATTGGNSRTVKFYVRSEIGGSYEGSNLARTFTIKNPNPTINPTITDSNSTTVALTGSSSKLVKYYSNAAITIGAAAVKGASLTSQKVTCGSKSLTANGTISAVESGSFVFTAKDSRGNTTTKTVTPSFVNYVKVTCGLGNNMPSADGTMTVKASGNYFNGSFGSKSNSLKVYYRYKPAGGSYGSWVAMTVTLSSNTYSATANVTGLDYQTNYVFQAYAADALATVYSSEKTVKATPVFDWGENDFRFNVPILPPSISISKVGETDTQLQSVFTAMGAATMHTFVLKQSVQDSLPVGGTWFVTIYKTSDSYGVIIAYRYYSTGSPCIAEYKRSIYGGVWSNWSKTPLLDEVAPAGFGLGGNSRWFTNRNQIEGCGFYQIDPEGKDLPDENSWWGTVSKLYNNHLIFTATRYDGCVAQSVKTNSGWQPWEWVNPPMNPGEEYRTTERRDGKPVYIKLIQAQFSNGISASGTTVTKEIQHNASNVSERWIHLAYTGNYTFPYRGNDVSVSQSSVIFRVENDSWNSSYVFSFIIKYTKTTD